ncbi:hypothetical protein Y1Q_0010817 [Alligator mississippiensis]|uniref:Uncharacterized protein n=1 Tax=Alligator mississippiensis TaxID=8496 RepID=A0A151M6Y9_ALLMI|nr:hypothetical protein Y1Q_0010817 [Alligator mississippiensis]
MPVPTTQGLNWSMEETGDLVALWDGVEVQCQFEQGGCSNAHVYKVLSDKCGHNQLVWQCLIEVKALQASWVTITVHNCAHKSMPFMQQLMDVLALRYEGCGCIVYSSTGGLPKPLP